MALTPEPLQPGAVLAAVSPAGPVGPDEVQRGAAVLAEAGYTVKRLPHALRQGRYLAGTDAQRASDLMDAFTDDCYQGIVCTRGGYGSVRTLDHLDYDRIAAHPKCFTGFSDITALQTALWQRAGLVTFSGPQLARGFGSLPRKEAKDEPSDEKGTTLSGILPFSSENWFAAVQGRLWGTKLPLPQGQKRLSTLRPGKAEGPLLGGNLAVLASLCGTAYTPRFEGAVVVLEEIDEPAYRIDRTITQLAMAGAFEGAKGVVLGSFAQHVQGDRLEWASLAANLVAEVLPEVPLVTGAPYGHVGPCWTLPLGGWAVLDADEGSLAVERGR